MSWGISDFLIGQSSRALDPMKSALLVNTYGAFVYSITYSLFLHSQANFTMEGVYYAIAGSVFFGLAQGAFFKAMSLGPIGLVSSISSVYPLVTLLVGATLFKERISSIHILGIVLIVVGVAVASGVSASKEVSQHIGKGPLLSLIPVFGFGIAWVFIPQSIVKMGGWQNTFLIEILLTPLTLALLVPLIKGEERITVNGFRKGWLLPAIWGAAVIQMFGLLAVNLGLSNAATNTTAVVAISTMYPMVTILLAFRHLRERVPFVPLLGGIAGVLGVVILSL
jgi:drug/metabolite transporter (DMT)-like permease